MKIIEDIICCEKPDDINYTNNINLIGKMIINPDNNTFEGIVKNCRSGRTSLIFGKLNKEYMELIRCPQDDYEFPKKYSCSKVENKYEGILFSLVRSKQIDYGTGEVKIYDPYEYRDITEAEVFTLEDEIITIKKRLGEEGNKTYNKFYKKGKK